MRAYPFIIATVVLFTTAYAQQQVPFRVHGTAWTDAGRIIESSDSLQGNGDFINVSGTGLQTLGAQIGVDAELGEHWNAAFGIGVYQATHSQGTSNQTLEPAFWSFSLFKPFVAEARLTYFRGDRANPWFSVTAGNFTYNYNPDVKNLGLYLLRGPVYPGILMSGFGEFDTDTTKATQTGFRIHHAIGNFGHDLLFVQERILPPTFDWSLAYVAKYRAFDALELGAGVNFYRVLPYSNPLEEPGRLTLGNPSQYEVDGTDTLYYTHQGTKLMAMFGLDLKPWIGTSRMGSNDLKLYGEAAIIGVKDYGTIYDDVTERMPVMVGFNFPTFGLLDLFSVEVEWYGSPYKNDLANIGNPASTVADWMNQTTPRPQPSPVPVQMGAYADSTADNWKWSVNLQKQVARHIQFTAQVANDHYRPRPVSTGEIWMNGGTAAAFTDPRDWYFMGRLGFFF